jgi:hypothetical protein
MLVKHVRYGATPFATIVATSPNNIGVSVCCSKDHFDKKRGIEIAAGRANLGKSPKYPTRRRIGNSILVRELLSEEVKQMKDRAKRYFKNPA